MKKILITGSTGFAGSHLAKYLTSHTNDNVFGTYFSEKSLVNVEKIRDKIKLIKIDLTKSDDVLSLIHDIKPEQIFHLAAFPWVGISYEKPLETIINNVSCELTILEAVRKSNLTNCRILVISSADVYGNVTANDVPIDEETPFRPTSTYAVSKITQDFLALQYHNSYGLPIIRARPFNHIGPRQGLGFVVADFAKKVVLIEKGKHARVLTVGDLTAKRDFTDVRDMVAAYVLLMEKGKSGDVYNIGSGKSHKIENILNMLLSLSKAKITVRIDKSLFRPGEALERVCDNRKFVKLTNWKPTIPLEQTLQDILDYWRDLV